MQNEPARRTALGIVLAAILLIIATSPLWTALIIKWHTARIVTDTLLGVTTSALANTSVSEGFLETSLALNATTQEDREKYIAEISRQTTNTDENLKKYLTGIRDDTDRKNCEHLLESRGQFREVRARVVGLLEQGHHEEAERLFNREGLAKFQIYLGALNEIVRYNMAEAVSRGAQIQRLSNILIGVQVVFLVFFIVYAFYVPLITLLERPTSSEMRQDI